MKGVNRRILQVNLRTCLLLVTLLGVYIGGYVTCRDPVVSFTQHVEFTSNLMTIRILPVYRSDYQDRDEAVPKRPRACFDYEPRCRFASRLSQVVFYPAAWIERTYGERFACFKEGGASSRLHANDSLRSGSSNGALVHAEQTDPREWPVARELESISTTAVP